MIGSRTSSASARTPDATPRRHGRRAARGSSRGAVARMVPRRGTRTFGFAVEIGAPGAEAAGAAVFWHGGARWSVRHRGYSPAGIRSPADAFGPLRPFGSFSHNATLLFAGSLAFQPGSKSAEDSGSLCGNARLGSLQRRRSCRSKLGSCSRGRDASGRSGRREAQGVGPPRPRVNPTECQKDRGGEGQKRRCSRPSATEPLARSRWDAHYPGEGNGCPRKVSRTK